MNKGGAIMKKIKILEDFFMYQFEPFGGRILGQNIFVLFGKSECIVFDAGYEHHLEAVIQDLNGRSIKYIICTHFHPDHVYGLNILAKQYVIGSINYRETLEFFKDLDNELFIPTQTIKDETLIEFGRHKINLSLNQGHSNCGMLIDIDGTHLLVGDDYIALNSGEPVLPYLAASLQIHIDGLKNIVNNFKGYTYLPSHGKETKNLADIEYRLRYLEFCKQLNTNLNDFYQLEEPRYINEKWHKVNISNIKKAKV